MCAFDEYRHSNTLGWVGGGAMALEITHGFNLLTAIHGSWVLVLLHNGEEGCPTRVFDFSPRGGDVLQFSNRNGGGIERKAVFEDGPPVFGRNEMVGLRVLGNSIVSHTVSLLPWSTFERHVN
jgi:hypothetical protein